MRPSTLSCFNFRRSSSAALAAATLLLTACANFQGIAPSAVGKDHVMLSVPNQLAQSRDVWPQDSWWTDYGDPQLNQLIDRALANSPNLATAQTRIARAQAAADLAQGAHAPQLNGALDASYGRLSENYQVPKPPLGKGGQSVSQGRAALDFNIDLDLWKKNAALIRSAEAQVKAAAFDREAARLALTTSVARAYAQLASQYDVQDVLEATLKQRQTIRDLATQRVASGLDTRVEQKQSESSEAALRADLAQLATTIELTRLQLAALAGDMPAAATNIRRPVLSNIAFTVPQTLPLDLLGRRPELAAQRSRINAAVGDAEAAKAQFYPNINLLGLVGFQSIGLGQLLSAGSLMSSVGPAIRLPIFDGGRLRANYAAKTADLDAVITQYNQSVVSAAQDVAEQLTRAAALAREEDATRDALAAAEEAHRLAMLRYRAGLSPYLTVLSVETQLLAQRRAATDLKARRQDVQIALVRALGGGFRDSHPALAVSNQP
jgi:NodT family efflux transporter outer membrane factor (OMF) lipoprotein